MDEYYRIRLMLSALLTAALLTRTDANDYRAGTIPDTGMWMADRLLESNGYFVPE